MLALFYFPKKRRLLKKKEKVITLRNGVVLSMEEAMQVKAQYEILCTQEYLEDNYSEVIPKEAMQVFAINVRNRMDKYDETEEVAIEELLKTSLPTLKRKEVAL